MNYDELAFFNQQLAAMLREGIPLEGAIRQLCADMNAGALRAEFDALGAALAKGIPLAEALSPRALPALYVRVVQAGARSNDLPGVLTLIADYYHRINATWTRLKGLLVYPALVLGVSLALTFVLTLLVRKFLNLFASDLWANRGVAMAAVWVPPVALSLLALVAVVLVSYAPTRAWLRWRLPAFREASLAQLASTLAVLLRNGSTLADALALGEQIENGSPAARRLAEWGRFIREGKGKPSQWEGPYYPFPDLFVWFIRKDDVVGGLEKAALLYDGRAKAKTEMLLYGALPISILLLGQMLLWQIAPLVKSLIDVMNRLGDVG